MSDKSIEVKHMAEPVDQAQEETPKPTPTRKRTTKVREEESVSEKPTVADNEDTEDTDSEASTQELNYKGETFSVEVEQREDGFYYVKESVYRTQQLPGSERTTRFLVAAAGTRLNKN